MSTILVIDDDHSILELVKINLEILGYNVITASDPIKGLALAKQEIPDLIILDVMMPEVDGFTVSSRLRQNQPTQHIPVLMLTALGMLQDKVKGFDSGADDYLVKPFEIPELKVRVKALLKRGGSIPASATMPELLSIGDFTLVPENLEIKVNDNSIKLTPTEYELLNCLIQQHGQAVSAGMLLKEVWGYTDEDDVETIRVHIRHLRSKLNKANPDKKYIETIYGGGYRLIPDGINK